MTMITADTPEPAEEMASTCLVEMTSGSHVFKINGYSLIQGLGVGRCLQSSKFTVDGHDWAIVFYPDGHEINADDGHVSVFVTLLSDTADGGAVSARVDFALLDQRCTPPVIKKESQLAFRFAERGASTGYAKFMSKAEVASSGLVHDDCLAIRCAVHVVRVREGEVAGTVAAVPQATVWTRAYRRVTTKTWPALRQRFASEPEEGVAFLLELFLRLIMAYLRFREREERKRDHEEFTEDTRQISIVFTKRRSKSSSS